MQDSIYNFWKDHSLANIKPNTGEEFPEGWNVVEFFKDLRTYGSIIEIGCGYGRLCKAFNSNNYLGMDISNSAIQKAKKTYVNYEFELIKDVNKLYPYSDTKILYTVLLHQCDEDINNIIENLCKTSETIIVAEICGRDWRREGNPPVFNREPEEYIALFADQGKCSVELIKKPYERYKKFNNKDTDLSIMVFE